VLNRKLKDIIIQERPRERLARLGSEALSNAELIAILIRTGGRGASALQLAHDMLVEFDGLEGLQRVSCDMLCSVQGIGQAKAAQIKAAVEVGRRIAAASFESRPTIKRPEDLAALVSYEMSALEQEHLRVALLNTRNQVIKIVEIYRGSLNTSVIRIAEIFKEPIRINAAAIIIIHNHPSGDPTPSKEDISVTRAMISAGKLLDIEVLDHLVIGANKFVSMKAKRMAFS